MTQQFNRREILQQGLLAGGAAVGFHLGSSLAAESKSPNAKLNLAAVGTANRAGSNISGCSSQNIVALADVDADSLDRAGQKYKAARTYRDFRVMLEKEADKIDAVIVATPDHTHAPAAAMALKMGKHVYCEKPLTHTVNEARQLAELAQQKKLVTQMGTQIHAGDNYRRVVELVQSGTIGKVREVHVWVGVNYHGGRLFNTKKPSRVDWDLWLGPTKEREYCEATINGKHETVHPYHWRWFWDFGSGGQGDFGCHYMDLPHWALKLRAPTHVAASGPPLHPDAATGGVVVKYKYPARDGLPPVALTWYDGGKKPQILSSLKDQSGKPLNWGGGQLFVGEHGMVLSNYSRHLLLPVDKSRDLKRPEPFIKSSIGHHKEWIEAIKTGGKTTCNFDYSGALTEAVLLGVASYRSGEPIQWDAKNLKVANSTKAQQFIHKEYRRGWTL